MKFNLNGKVRVKLNKLGHSIHLANHLKFYENYPIGSKPVYVQPEQDDDGWSTWQLWDLMKEFGVHMHNGVELPMETEIDLPEDQDI